MAEEVYMANVERVHYGCDVCGEGRLEPTGRILVAAGVTHAHEHICSKCGDVQILDKTYPFIRYVDEARVS